MILKNAFNFDINILCFQLPENNVVLTMLA